MVAAHRRGLTDERVTAILDGGNLEITWPDRGHVLMTGPTALSFEGTFDAALLTS
jgi:diaminopimelate epimerase